MYDPEPIRAIYDDAALKLFILFVVGGLFMILVTWLEQQYMARRIREELERVERERLRSERKRK